MTSPSRPKHRTTGRAELRLVLASLAVAAVVLGLAACGSDDDSSSTTEPSSGATEPAPAETDLSADALDGRTFTSTDVEGKELVDGSTLTFSFEGDMLGVNAGCNQQTTSYEIDGTTLRWTGVPAATMMACSDELMAQDTWVTELLTAGVEASLEGASLTMVSGGVTVVAEEQAAEELPIVGTAWALESITTGETVSSVPVDVEAPTLSFADDGTVEVYAGCNRGGTTATIAEDGSTITFDPIATTKMACSPAAMDLEAQVLAVLDGEVQASTADGQLTLTNGDTALTYTAG